MSEEFKFPKKVVIQMISYDLDTLAKVPAELICDMDIVNYISKESYLGTQTTPWNEIKFAFLCEDDVPVFIQACQFWGVQTERDWETLQSIFDNNCENKDEWLTERDDEGDSCMHYFDSEALDWLGIEASNFVSIDKWKELTAFLNDE